MIDRLLRPVKDYLIRPIATRLGASFSPTAVSLVGFGLGIATALLVIMDHLVLAFIFWILNRFLDGLDGAIARETGRQTDFGGYMDILLDFTIYAALPLAFAVRIGSSTVLIIACILIGVFYVNAASWMYLSILIEKNMALGESADAMVPEFTSVTMPTGIVEGAETILLFSLFFLFADTVGVLFLITAAATCTGIIQRIVWAWRRFPTSKSTMQNEKGDHKERS